MVRHAYFRSPFHVLLRANRTLVLALLWAALAACIVGSLAFDVAGWLNAWKSVSLEALRSAPTV